ncbi:MAG: 2'-5' RNA ligase family protein [Desulfitobacterium sp.]|nr:2'-5' RNA ligase family protein [Desulfitobacterium sp.]
MKIALNLYFDQKAERQIIAIWERLARIKVGKCMSCSNGRPHITLAIYQDVNPDILKEKINVIAEKIPGFELKFLQIGIFPHNKGAIFLAPSLKDELFHSHRLSHTELQEISEHCWDYYKPHSWYPHCTLSLETPLNDIPKVIQEIIKDFQPIDVKVDSIGLVSLDPLEYLTEIKLK